MSPDTWVEPIECQVFCHSDMQKHERNPEKSSGTEYLCKLSIAVGPWEG